MTIRSSTLALTFALLTAGCSTAKAKLAATRDRALGREDPHDPTQPAMLADLSFDLTLRNFQSCDELAADVRAQLALRAANEAARRQYLERPNKNSAKKAATAAQESAASKAKSADTDDSAAEDLSSESESFTNVQEKSVDESDFVKIGAAHVFVARGPRIEVIDRETLEPLGQLPLEGLDRLTLYAEADRLTMIGQLEIPRKACHQVERFDFERPYGQKVQAKKVVFERCFAYKESATVVRVYTAAPKAMPALVSERLFTETYKDSRFIAGHVVLLFTSSLPLLRESNLDVRCGLDESCYQAYYSSPGFGGDADGSDRRSRFEAPAVTPPEQPVVIAADGTVGGVPCGAISKPFIGDNDFRLTKVASLDTRTPDAPVKYAAVVGGGDQVYMTTTGLYIAKQGVRWTPWAPPTNAVTSDTAWDKQHALEGSLIVTKIAFSPDTGDLAVRAVGAVRGVVKDQWAFKEYPDARALAIATTTESKIKPETATEGLHNHLWILQEEGETLALKAAINDFGPTEDIRAARYIGSMAYIVTFKKTDPLFAFDLSDPLAPKLRSELKIPGFSMYLHPLADGRLLGVGYDADDQGSFAWFQGVQVSLFDTSDPTNLSRLDVHVLGHRGSYSDVTGDHKAFFHHAEHNLIGIPVVEKIDAEGGGQGFDQAAAVAFTGAILYRLEGDRLEEAARISHADLVPAACKSQDEMHWWQDARRSLDINRLYEVDGRLVSVSRFGIKAYDPAAPGAGPTATTAFEALGTADCGTRDDATDW